MRLCCIHIHQQLPAFSQTVEHTVSLDPMQGFINTYAFTLYTHTPPAPCLLSSSRTHSLSRFYAGFHNTYAVYTSKTKNCCNRYRVFFHRMNNTVIPFLGQVYFVNNFFRSSLYIRHFIVHIYRYVNVMLQDVLFCSVVLYTDHWLQ